MLKPTPRNFPRRIVEPELLDELPPADPRAERARRDLRRVNAWMGNGRILFRALSRASSELPVRTIAELGGGDGRLMLKLARRMASRWPGVRVLLIDRHNLLESETERQFARLGWSVQPVTADVFEWLPRAPETDLIIANLFLHHFKEDALRSMFGMLAGLTPLFAACETRRFPFAQTAGWLLWLIGCGAVTRHDGVISVRAGFVDGELSGLWPNSERWKLTEGRAGVFSHCFVARRGSLEDAGASPGEGGQGHGG
jgi:hypothetical protein